MTQEKRDREERKKERKRRERGNDATTPSGRDYKNG